MASPGAVVVAVGVAVVVVVVVAVAVAVVVVVVAVVVVGRPEMSPSEARLASILAALGRAVEGGHAWSVYPSEATVLLAEIERLRALEADAIADHIERGEHRREGEK